MKRYNYQIASGNLTKRQAVGIAGKKGPLHDLVGEIREEAQKDDVDIEEVVGILRHEANRIESLYIRALEDVEEGIAEQRKEEIIKEYVLQELEE